MTECPGHFGFLKLALPIFHVGYFKHTVSILQCICKTCSRVLLSDEERQRHLRRTSTNREPSQNLKILKTIIDDCKKMQTCCHCGAYNGTVKKKPNEALKIIHEKFRVSKEHDIDDLIKQFEYSCSVNPELERHIKEFCEDLDPLKV
jgi:DNA-directed RNA polymerase III subunit RPC1